MTKHTVLTLALSAIAGAAWAQSPTPTGAVRTGNLSLGRANLSISAGPLGAFQSTTDVFAASFALTDFSKFIPPDLPPTTTIGQCTVLLYTPGPGTPPPDNSGAVTLLDAGPVINLTGPNGSKTFASKQLSFGGVLGGGTAFPGAPAPAPLYLDPGPYTVDNGGGGADVGPFTATITIPATFAWTNADDPSAQTIDRSAGVDIAWAGGDPNSMVFITGGVATIDPVSHQLSAGGVYTCRESNSAGHFFVSPDVLSLLPASSSTNGVPNGLLIVSDSVQATFSAPGIDAGNFIFSSVTTRNPAYI